MAATVSVVSANLRQASSVRARSTYARRFADFGEEHPDEMAAAHGRATGQLGDRVSGTRIGLDGLLRLSNCVTGRPRVQSGVSNRREAPAPQRYRTRQRATSWATSAPKSASTIASAVSIPPTFQRSTVRSTSCAQPTSRSRLTSAGTPAPNVPNPTGASRPGDRPALPPRPQGGYRRRYPPNVAPGLKRSGPRTSSSSRTAPNELRNHRASPTCRSFPAPALPPSGM